MEGIFLLLQPLQEEVEVVAAFASEKTTDLPSVLRSLALMRGNK